jgi:hypothetical protein
VETFDDCVGPLVVAQAVTPVTPVIDHVGLPVGAETPEGPVTVAVKVMVEPRFAFVAFAITETVGTVVVTEVVDPDVGEVAK